MSVTAKALNTYDHVMFQFFFNKSAKMCCHPLQFLTEDGTILYVPNAA